jgi:hypothetical protein
MQVAVVVVVAIKGLEVDQQLALQVQVLVVKVVGIKKEVMHLILEEVLQLQTVVLEVAVEEIMPLLLLTVEEMVVLAL